MGDLPSHYSSTQPLQSTCSLIDCMHVQHWPPKSTISTSVYNSTNNTCTSPLIAGPIDRYPSSSNGDPHSRDHRPSNVVTADEPAFSFRSHQTTVLARLKIEGCATTVTYCAVFPAVFAAPTRRLVPSTTSSKPSTQPARAVSYPTSPSRTPSHWTTASAMLAQLRRQQSSTPSMSRPRSTSSRV